MSKFFRTEAFEYSPADSNFVSVTKGYSETNIHSSETNSMPGHRRNVHEEALGDSCNYHPFEATLAAVQKSHFSHSPYATATTLRFRNLAFERHATMVKDIQCILYNMAGPEPVVTSVRLSEPGRPFIEATVITAYPGDIVAKINKKVMVMDRYGYHVARGTVDTAVSARPAKRNVCIPKEQQQVITTSSTPEVQAALDYCKAVRQLPQKERHFKLDGLPCVPVRVELVSATESH